MEIIADLHLHSKYARATSPKSNIPGLIKGAKKKGINLLGTGDYTHPEYFQHLQENLEKDPETGFYNYKQDKNEEIYFIPSTEISNEYRENGEMKKIHQVVISPDLETVEQINDVLKQQTDLSIDGRPTFNLTAPETVEKIMEVSKKNLIIPAHVWTPHYSLFGSNSGFDSVEECYKDQEKHINALETGLSADPEMFWRLSSLDNYTLISNSDSHSPYPYRMGREANIMKMEEPSYEKMVKGIRKGEILEKTIEFYPEEGKYHWDGHRKCNISMDPRKAMEKFNNICPSCGKPMTLGVMHRVEELADRKPGEEPEEKTPFTSLIPLQKIISLAIDTGMKTKTVEKKHRKLINRFGTELNVLLRTEKEQIEQETNRKIAEYIEKTREGKVKWKPGYDGVYGEPIFEEDEKKDHEENEANQQQTLKDF